MRWVFALSIGVALAGPANAACPVVTADLAGSWTVRATINDYNNALCRLALTQGGYVRAGSACRISGSETFPAAGRIAVGADCHLVGRIGVRPPNATSFDFATIKDGDVTGGIMMGVMTDEVSLLQGFKRRR